MPPILLLVPDRVSQPDGGNIASSPVNNVQAPMTGRPNEQIVLAVIEIIRRVRARHSQRARRPVSSSRYRRIDL